MMSYDVILYTAIVENDPNWYSTKKYFTQIDSKMSLCCFLELYISDTAVQRSYFPTNLCYFATVVVGALIITSYSS